jgi:isocitrate lyase
MYKKMQDKKKNIVLLGAIDGNHLDDVERLVKTLDPTGLYLSGWVGSEDDCKRFVENVTRWCE